ncbi:MAG: ribulose-phosphate 3-epimerase [Nitrospirota bacterium]
MVRIAPSILSADFRHLADEVKRVEDAGADMIHIDVMDGHFVPNITIGPVVVKAVRETTSLPLDVHLMIISPQHYIKAFSDAGADIITVHVEACIHLHRVVQSIRDIGLKAGVSLNPSTPLSSLEHILRDVDMVLLMSVNPGFGGQEFIPNTFEKIIALRRLIEGMGVDIEVDGGIKVDNAAEVSSAGADILVIGSGIFTNRDYRKTIRDIKKRCEGLKKKKI